MSRNILKLFCRESISNHWKTWSMFPTKLMGNGKSFLRKPNLLFGFLTNKNHYLRALKYFWAFLPGWYLFLISWRNLAETDHFSHGFNQKRGWNWQYQLCLLGLWVSFGPKIEMFRRKPPLLWIAVSQNPNQSLCFLIWASYFRN